MIAQACGSIYKLLITNNYSWRVCQPSRSKSWKFVPVATLTASFLIERKIAILAVLWLSYRYSHRGKVSGRYLEEDASRRGVGKETAQGFCHLEAGGDKPSPYDNQIPTKRSGSILL